MAIDPAGEVYIAGTAGASFSNDARRVSVHAAVSEWFGRGRQAECVRVGAALRDVPVRQWAECSARDRDRRGGRCFVAGYTQAPDFPVTPEHCKPPIFRARGNMEFVTKLNPQEPA